MTNRLGTDFPLRGIHAFTDYKTINRNGGYTYVCPEPGCKFEPSWDRAEKDAAFGTVAKAKGEIRRHIIQYHPERCATWDHPPRELRKRKKGT